LDSIKDIDSSLFERITGLILDVFSVVVVVNGREPRIGVTKDNEIIYLNSIGFFIYQ
jgi:hypothetical protein